MIKKALVILISLALTQGVMGLCFTEDVKGITRGEIVTKEGKDAGGITGDGTKYLAQAPSRVIRLTGASAKVALPPPCTVIGVKGEKITLKDFYGKEETIEVEEFTQIRVGDKVVVKDGMLIIGISPK